MPPKTHAAPFALLARPYDLSQEIELAPLADLKRHPRNYQTHPQDEIEHLMASLRQHGWYKNIVIARDNTILAGHGLVEAAQQLGLEVAAVMRLDVDPHEAAALKIVAGDNEIGRVAIRDEAALVRLLQEVRERDAEGLAGTGVDAAMLEALVESVSLENIVNVTLSPSTPLFPSDIILDTAFAYYREHGFPYKRIARHMAMQELNKLALLDDTALLKTRLGYDIADHYHPHRMHGAAHAMRSPYEAFHDDIALRKALALQWEDAGNIGDGWLHTLSIVNGTQACANFRPGIALAYYRRYCHANAVVLDTSTGYGGRLIGFLASGFAGRYIGIDPNTKAHTGNVALACDLGFADHIELYNLPVEDIDIALVKHRCDFAFTSPPYFMKEHYTDEETQSWKRYPQADAWRQGFLQSMLALQYEALKPGAYAVINIEDVTIGSSRYPLVQWTREDAEKSGFVYCATEQIALGRRVGLEEDDVAEEAILIFQKPF